MKKRGNRHTATQKKARMMMAYANEHTEMTDRSLADHFGYVSLAGWRRTMRSVGYVQRNLISKDPLSFEQIKPLCEKHIEGATLPELAKELDVSKSKLRYWITHYGYNLKTRAWENRENEDGKKKIGWDDILYSKRLGMLS